MESGVKDCDLRSPLGENVGAGAKRKSVRMVVNRCKLRESIDLIDDFFGYHAGFVKYLSALNDSVSDSGYLIHRVDDLAVACGENFYKLFKSLGVGGEIAVLIKSIVARGDFVGNVTVDADAVAVALCDNGFIIHVEKLIL